MRKQIVYDPMYGSYCLKISWISIFRCSYTSVNTDDIILKSVKRIKHVSYYKLVTESLLIIVHDLLFQTSVRLNSKTLLVQPCQNNYQFVVIKWWNGNYCSNFCTRSGVVLREMRDLQIYVYDLLNELEIKEKVNIFIEMSPIFQKSALWHVKMYHMLKPTLYNQFCLNCS